MRARLIDQCTVVADSLNYLSFARCRELNQATVGYTVRHRNNELSDDDDNLNSRRDPIPFDSVERVDYPALRWPNIPVILS